MPYATVGFEHPGEQNNASSEGTLRESRKLKRDSYSALPVTNVHPTRRWNRKEPKIHVENLAPGLQTNIY